MDLLKSSLRSSNLTFYLLCFWVVLLPLREQFIDNSEIILRRIAISDIVGILIIISYLFKEVKRSVQFPRLVTNFILGTFFLMGCFSLGVFVSQKFLYTIIELVAILFLFSIYRVAIEEFNTEKHFQILVQLIIGASLLVSIYGLVDLYFAELYVSKSTFRNRGQAGTFMLYFCSIISAYTLSPFFEKHDKRQKNFIKFTLVLSIIFLISTLKLAATIGIFSGFIFFLLFKKKWKVLLGFSGVLAILYIFPELFPNRFYNIFVYSVGAKIDLLKEGNFYYDHYTAAVNCFLDNPILGSGLGGFHKVYHSHEVHSNYLKVLATTGIIGTIGYIFFIYQILKLFRNTSIQSQDNPYKKILASLFPFMIGCAVSWIYTYHLRSREFWLLMIFITICYSLASKETQKGSNHNLRTNA